MFQEKQGSGFLEVLIDTKLYENSNLNTLHKNLKANLDVDKKIIKYKEADTKVCLNYFHIPIIKREDKEKSIIISQNNVKINLLDLDNKIFLDIIKFEYSIKDNIIIISYTVKDTDLKVKLEIKLKNSDITF